jgi:hypothetical protein
MASALAAAGHRVLLGQRCLAPARGVVVGSDGAPSSAARVAINQGIDSPPGALMHEGDPDDHPSYDEYFVPIPLKCLGDLGGEMNDIHPCFEPEVASHYWRGGEAKRRSMFTPTETFPFADVRMNTVGGPAHPWVPEA